MAIAGWVLAWIIFCLYVGSNIRRRHEVMHWKGHAEFWRKLHAEEVEAQKLMIGQLPTRKVVPHNDLH